MTDQQKASLGIITADPTEALPAGSTMQFLPVHIQGEVPLGLAAVKNWNCYEGVMLSLGFSDPTHVSVEGSAVLVAPGIAIAATHVIDPHKDDLISGRLTAYCFSIASHGVMIWNVRKVTVRPKTDITILGLVLSCAMPPNNIFRHSAITTRTPAIGEDVQILGFRATEPTFTLIDGVLKTSGNILISRGVVTKRYPNGRDSAMLSWPVLEVEVRTEGGMSGGPVFDRNGLLLGILCSSFDFGLEGGISYVSLIWPALTIRFEALWPSGFFKNPISLFEMDNRICEIDKRDVLTVEYDEVGNVRTQYYSAW